MGYSLAARRGPISSGLYCEGIHIVITRSPLTRVDPAAPIGSSPSKSAHTLKEPAHVPSCSPRSVPLSAPPPAVACLRPPLRARRPRPSLSRPGSRSSTTPLSRPNSGARLRESSMRCMLRGELLPPACWHRAAVDAERARSRTVDSVYSPRPTRPRAIGLAVIPV